MKIVVIASLFAACIALVLYVTSIIAVHGIRKSISDSNYFLQKPFKLVFEMVMWICGLSIVITGLFIKEYADWWIIGGGVGILFVGVFSDFKKHIIIQIAHYISAIGGFALLGLSFYFSFGRLDYTIIIAVSALIASLFAKKRIWCLELTMAIEVFAGLFYLAHLLM
ncbi:MAG: hypothetical protein PF481_07670 [Bacteroidales bacterium]|jgi:hypothetical protein|nr:hypothetical protein [Bacteroidales bacterium]